jgi:hypothetical protein
VTASVFNSLELGDSAANREFISPNREFMSPNGNFAAQPSRPAKVVSTALPPLRTPT